MTERKEQLRAAALDYLVAHGIADASLRPIAAALGTSARILMFHFKSKEGLLREVMEELQRRLQDSFIATMSKGSGRTAPLKRFWQWATQPENASHLRLLYEAQVLAMQNPREYGRYLKESSTRWRELSFDAMSQALRSGPMAILCIAVFDGLMLEFLGTNDLEGTTKAMDLFIQVARRGTKARAAAA